MSPSSAAAPAVISDYILDAIFPKQEIHLLSGPSGSGKTTWLFQFIDDWRNGRDVLERTSHPAPFCYVSCDHSESAVRRMLKRLAIPPFPLFTTANRKIPRTIDRIIESAISQVPDLRVLFIDGIEMLTPDGKVNDYAVVARFLNELTSICHDLNLTIIGSGHSPKTKEGERYSSPRQRFLGTVAWGGYSETMIHIEPAIADLPADPSRILYVMPREAPTSVYDLQLDVNGRLVPRAAQLEASVMFAQTIDALPMSTPFKTSELLAFAAQHQIGTATGERLIADLVAAGRLERIKRGVYRRPWAT